MIDEQAKLITKEIAPKYPLGYKDTYPVVFSYLQECFLSNTKYTLMSCKGSNGRVLIKLED